MNRLDLVILIILALAAFVGYRRGLLRAVYRLVSFVIALVLARWLYAPVADLLRGTALYTRIKDGIAGTLNIEGAFMERVGGLTATTEQWRSITEGISLPPALQDLIYRHALPDIQGILRLEAVEEGIAGFFAGTAVNVIAMLIVFMVVMLLLSIGGMALGIVERLPVINTLNHAGGLVFGLVLGAGIVWLGLAIMTMLIATNPQGMVYELMQDSAAARWLMDGGWLLPGLDFEL